MSGDHGAVVDSAIAVRRQMVGSSRFIITVPLVHPFGSMIVPVVLLPLALFTGSFLWYALVFFVLALVAALVGARGVAGLSMEIARLFVVLFLVLAIVSLIL